MTRHLGTVGVLLLCGLPLGAVQSDRQSSSLTDPQSSVMSEGKKIFDQNCASCHQQNGTGIPGSIPPLAGNSNIKNAKLIVETIHHGHSGPITVEGKKFNNTMPPIGAGFSAKQTADVATYARNSWGNSFGSVTPQQVHQILGTSASGSQSGQTSSQSSSSGSSSSGQSTSSSSATSSVRPSFASLGSVQRGGRFFRLNCIPCHSATARGGALVFVGRNAPSLMHVSPAAIPSFVRAGVGPMPAFKKEIFTDQDVSDIAAYIKALQTPQHPGGFGIGFLGPTTEGFIVVVFGLGAAVLAAFFIEMRGRG